MAKVGLIRGLGCVTALLIPVIATAQGSESERPCEVMSIAAHAVTVDSAAPLRTAWTDRLAHNPRDRFATIGLASLDLVSGRLSAADSGFAAAGSFRSADALQRCADLGTALVLSAEGRYAASAATLAPVAATARAEHDTLVEVHALLTLVTLESRGRAANAAAHLARADSLIPPSDLALRAAALCARANLMIATHAPGAITTAAEGAAMARRGGDPRIAADCELTAAINDALRGEMNSANTEFGVVIAHAQLSHYPIVEGIALQWRGYGHLTNGHYAESEDYLERALAVGHSTGSLNTIGWSELNLAALFGLLGDFPSDRRHAERAHAALAAAGDSAGLGILRREEGEAALAVGDTDYARASFQNAASAAEKTGRAVDIMAARNAIAELDLREGDIDAAAAVLESEQALLAKSSASAWGQLMPWKQARIAIARHQWQAALRDLSAARTTIDSSQHLYLYQIHEDQALAELGVGDTTLAMRTLGRANDELDTWRAGLGTDDLRILAFQNSQPIYGTWDGAVAVTAAAARTGRIATAFAFAERRRARDLADQLRRADAVRQGGTGAQGSTAGEHPPTTAPIVSLAQMERLIPDDTTAILEYVTGAGPSSTTLIIITRRGAKGVLVAPTDSLRDAIARYDALVEQGAGAAAPARALGVALVDPALSVLSPTVHRLIIVPDGVLNRVAFGALRMADGTPLLVHAAVGFAPSATVLADLWVRAHPARSTLLLAFGDPVLPHEARATGTELIDSSEAFDRGAAAGLDATGQLPRLPWTADEARLVGAFSPQSVVRLRADASASYLELSSLTKFSIIHFATHAVVDEDSPLLSALVLAPGGGASGFVGPGELAALHLTADLVVLSACRTARGQIIGGEGVRGLITPILASGARSVLATRWRLNDRDAVPLIYSFYQGLASGLPVIEASRRAELSAYRRNAPEREWAAFILVGDPLVRVPLQTPASGQVPQWLQSATKGSS